MDPAAALLILIPLLLLIALGTYALVLASRVRDQRERTLTQWRHLEAELAGRHQVISGIAQALKAAEGGASRGALHLSGLLARAREGRGTPAQRAAAEKELLSALDDIAQLQARKANTGLSQAISAARAQLQDVDTAVQDYNTAAAQARKLLRRPMAGWFARRICWSGPEAFAG